MTRYSRPQPVVLAFGIVASSVLSSRAIAQGYCGNPRPPPCTDDDCCSSSTDTTTGDPIDLAYHGSILARTDAEIRGTIRPFKLLRFFSSDTRLWSNNQVPKVQIPPPFGYGTSDTSSLNWWHTFFSYVYEPPAAQGAQVFVDVRVMGGHELDFGCSTCWPSCSACETPPYWLQSSQPSDAQRLRLESAPNGGVEYSLFGSDNRRYVFATPITEPNAGLTYLLSSVQEAGGSTTATVTYGQPRDVNGVSISGCPGLDADGGSPYVAAVANEDGALFDFRYAALTDPSLGTECVLAEVLLGDENDAGPGTEVAAATYAYVNNQPGSLLAVTTGPGTPAEATESYDAGASSFSVIAGDGGPGSSVTLEHTYASTNCSDVSSVSGASSPMDGLSVTYDCNTGTDVDCGLSYVAPEVLTSTTASRGDGTAGPAGLEREVEIQEQVGLLGPARVYYTDSCSWANSCSPGTVNTFWWPWGNPNCNGPSYPAFVQDKRGDYTLTPHVMPDGGSQFELAGLQRGVTDFSLFDAGMPVYPDCLADGGDCEWYGYTYGLNGAPLRSSVTRASVVDAGAWAQTLSNYDPTTDRLTSMIKSGYTLTPTGDALVYRGTFYFTAQDGGQPNPEGRTLETHGPCWVTGATSTGCDDQSPFPVTDFTYYPPGVGLNSNRLQSVTKWTNGWGSGTLPLTTTYSNYDLYGNARAVVDPNGVETDYTYVGRRVTSKTVSGVTTTYAYDNGKLASIQYPEGNFEILCYRTGSTGACSAGTFTPLLQWRAMFDSTLTTFSEKIAYTYWPDGTVATKSFEDGSGTVRRIRQYQKDAQGRPTWEGWGGTAGSPIYTAVRGFDPSDNVNGVGLPFNAAQAYCEGPNGEGTSELCTQLTSDPADRLVSAIQHVVEGGYVIPVATNFARDTNGNVCVVTPGASSSWARSCTDVGAADDPTTAFYQHDDFGNLIGASLPDTVLGGRYGYIHDARGRLVEETRPDGSGLTYSYDQLGRLLSVQDLTSGAVAYRLTYDTPANPLACNPQTNTYGRLSTATDSFGTTYYSYDADGHVTQEQRIRAGTIPWECSPPANGTNPDSSPTATYAYNANGDLVSIVYPHDREIDYVYGAPLGSALSDRVASVNVGVWNGTAWQTPATAISNVAWEPYGGLRAYQVNGASAAGVEYMLGGSAAESDAGCPGQVTDLGANDATGLPKAVWVSSGPLALGGGAGDVLKIVYSWQADQVKTRDMCVLQGSGGAPPRRETFNPTDFAYDVGTPGYDTLLRVTHAEMPNQEENGGPYGVRNFGCESPRGCTTALGYDARGNVTPGGIWSENGVTNAYSLTYSPTADLPDQLTGWQSTGGLISYAFGYDSEGRATTQAGQADTSGYPPTLNLGYQTDSTGSALDIVRSATYTAEGQSYGSFDYYWDAFQRRRMKVYPVNGMTDEYFYDRGHQMLEDRGWQETFTSLPDGGVGVTTTFPEDDYVWLGGRPVAYVRGQLMQDSTGTWYRSSDSTSNCSRNGDELPCGTYFVVTDHIGKPVISLGSLAIPAALEITGVYDHDVYGEQNMETVQAGTGAYGNNLGLPLPVLDAGSDVIADVVQKPATGPGGAPLRVDVALHLSTVDTESAAGPDGGLVPVDYAMVVDMDTGQCLMGPLDAGCVNGPIGGHESGRQMTPWLPTTAGRVDVLFYSNGQNCCPLMVDGGFAGDDCTCSQYPQYTDGGVNGCTNGASCWFPYSGVTVEAAYYREYQPAAPPVALPLRFPGQYQDLETGLVENWHRFYDTITGRYLEPEPILAEAPALQAGLAKKGGWLSTYAYAADNPLTGTDPTGQFKPGGGLIDSNNNSVCPAYSDAVTAAQDAIGCDTATGSPKKSKCKGKGAKAKNACQEAMGACGVNPMSVCELLTNGEENDLLMTRSGSAPGSSCGPPPGNDPTAYATVSADSCANVLPKDVETQVNFLANTLIHEAIHIASGCRIDDYEDNSAANGATDYTPGAVPCTAGAIADVCVPEE